VSETTRDIAPTIRELGRRLGVGHTTVLRALKTHRIKALPGGGYDVEQCRADWKANTKRGRPSKVTQPERRTARTRTIEPSDDVDDDLGGRGLERVEVAADALAAVTETLEAHGSPVTGRVTMFDAQTAHEIIKAHKTQLDVHRLKGQTVERGRAWDALSTFTRTERDAFQAWPAAAAPAMASELGVEDLGLMETVLARHVRAFIESLANVPPPGDLLPTT
jgi:hypothetical protein